MAAISENVKDVEQNVCQNWKGGRLLFESVQGIFTSNLNLSEVREDFRQSAWDDLTFT